MNHTFVCVIDCCRLYNDLGLDAAYLCFGV